MVVRRSISKRNYILAFVLTAMIFVIAFFGGMITDRIFLDDIENFNDETRFNLFRAELRDKMMGDGLCSYAFESPLVEEFVEISNEIIHLENRLGKDNWKVIELKKYYTLLEMYDWLHYKKLKENCGSNYDSILYFYSNQDDENGEPECECDRQGFILGYIKENNPNVRIYSFDYHLEIEEIEILKEKYGITEVPTFVINGNVLHGFSELEAIEYFL